MFRPIILFSKVLKIPRKIPFTVKIDPAGENILRVQPS